MMVALLADAAPTDPTGGLLSYGVLGIVVVCLITGVLVPGYLYKREAAENERLRKLVDEKVYPTIEAATHAILQASEVQREMLSASLSPPRKASR